jgi:hypothetical protein
VTRGVAALGVTAGNYAAASAWAGHSASAAGRDQLLIKLGTARKEAGPAAWPIIDLRLPETDQAVTLETFGFRLNWQNLRQAHRREGNYLLRWCRPCRIPPRETARPEDYSARVAKDGLVSSDLKIRAHQRTADAVQANRAMISSPPI